METSPSSPRGPRRLFGVAMGLALGATGCGRVPDPSFPPPPSVGGTGGGGAPRARPAPLVVTLASTAHGARDRTLILERTGAFVLEVSAPRSSAGAAPAPSEAPALRIPGTAPADLFARVQGLVDAAGFFRLAPRYYDPDIRYIRAPDETSITVSAGMRYTVTCVDTCPQAFTDLLRELEAVLDSLSRAP